MGVGHFPSDIFPGNSSEKEANSVAYIEAGQMKRFFAT